MPAQHSTEFRSLIKAVRDSDPAAEDRLIRLNYDFINRTAWSIGSRKGVDPHDAIQEALLTVKKAAEDFDLRRRTQFRTYLWHKIRGAITELARREKRSRITMNWWMSEADWWKNERSQPTKGSRELGRPVADYWPEEARRYVRSLRRRNDRLVSKWLWLDWPPKPQSEVARRLSISRSAVTQRKHKLQSQLFSKFGKLYMGELLIGKPLNEWWLFDMYD